MAQIARNFSAGNSRELTARKTTRNHKETLIDLVPITQESTL
jgi:hypothetical protein